MNQGDDREWKQQSDNMSSNTGSASPSIAVVDVETTGLFPWRHDRIVEIAIVRTSQDGEVDSEYDSLVNPDRDMGPARIHGISGAEVCMHLSSARSRAMSSTSCGAPT